MVKQCPGGDLSFPSLIRTPCLMKEWFGTVWIAQHTGDWTHPTGNPRPTNTHTQAAHIHTQNWEQSWNCKSSGNKDTLTVWGWGLSYGMFCFITRLNDPCLLNALHNWFMHSLKSWQTAIILINSLLSLHLKSTNKINCKDDIPIEPRFGCQKYNISVFTYQRGSVWFGFPVRNPLISFYVLVMFLYIRFTLDSWKKATWFHCNLPEILSVYIHALH
jgi:hypothetical protein